MIGDKAIRTFRRLLASSDYLAAEAGSNRPPVTSERQPDGSVRHSMTLKMEPVPPEYAAVYRRRGMDVPLAASGKDPAALWPDLPREPHKRHANANGYYWLPCPLCGREFGGHEITDSIHLAPDDPGLSTHICPACSADRNGGQP